MIGNFTSFTDDITKMWGEAGSGLVEYRIEQAVQLCRIDGKEK